VASTVWSYSTTLQQIAVTAHDYGFKKIYISSKTDRIGGGEESNSSHGSSIQNSLPFLAYTYE